ncbi:hypothetical protein HPB47_014511 [Ixodes persulcatus]|uniref:Uncharacterized protein n=1 Tax=Ixodes persulcatus TaxID=34615 RepID=A0AC60QVX7_IXOPE|nr:hypothetical protein HPB47_014511 [Ixodes persulcatus]
MEQHSVSRADDGLPATSTATDGAHAVRLPPFWSQHLEVWFLQAEGSFRLANLISQDVRFSHVQASLPREVALEVYDILARPPAYYPYDALRAAILERTMLSGRQRLQQLVLAENWATVTHRNFSARCRHFSATVP